jgi:NAD(P)H-hydrate repair Nnr-like enzyme with NAD(P)H-hydrate dehydratase domain
MLGCTSTTVQQDRLLAAETLSEALQCTVILKGSGTIIASPGEVSRINTSGNGALAVGGTGDVLAGLTGALLAQGNSAHAAASMAAWRHGASADHWPQNEPLTASQLARHLL